MSLFINNVFPRVIPVEIANGFLEKRGDRIKIQPQATTDLSSLDRNSSWREIAENLALKMTVSDDLESHRHKDS